MGAGRTTVSLLDGLAVFWVFFWLMIGTYTGVQVWQLSGLSDTAQVSADAVDTAGTALQGLSELPVLGQASKELGDEVRAAAVEISRSAEQTREVVHRLSVLLGLSVTLIPVSSVLGFYLPLRLRRRAQVRAIRQEISAGRRDAPMDAYLAHKAVNTMSYGQLLAVSRNPAGDLAEGRHRRLADAHLQHLGLAVAARR